MNSTYTILVADDDVDDRKMINDALGALPIQFEIVNLENGVEVMDYLLKRGRFEHVTASPDLIFLDLNMPIVDGFEVLKGIRLQQVLTSIPVHVITVSRNPADEEKARKLGVTGFHNKGYKTEDLRETVRLIVSGHLPFPGLGEME